jgi:D-3-phosphoglycerate dehydrogenase
MSRDREATSRDGEAMSRDGEAMSRDGESTSRVVLLDPAGQVETVRDALADHPEVNVERAETLPAADDVIAVLVPPEIAVGAAELKTLPDLKLVAATSTGFDHLDLKAIAAAGVWATHCAGYCDEEVAEHAITFALDLLRGVTLLDRAVRAGEWNEVRVQPRRVAGAVLGVVGLGRIGREVARRGRALGMRVLAADPLIELAGAGDVELVSLARLLSEAEVVTLHTPLTESTRKMIDAAALAGMQPGAFLINCARPGLVDHAALGAALRSGALAGCALDVLPHEPPAPDEPALDWPNTLVNPHMAYYSPQTATAPYRLCGEAVAAVLAGREPSTLLARPAAPSA